MNRTAISAVSSILLLASQPTMLGVAPIPTPEPAPAPTEAIDPNVLLRELEALVESGDIDRATDRLASDADWSMLDAFALRSLARVYAATGDTESAIETYRRADLASTTDRHRAGARFDLGVLLMQDVMSAMRTNPADVDTIEPRLVLAADVFRSVLDVAPGDAVAARNVERIRRMVQATRDQREQQQQQNEQMRELAEDLENLAEQQQAAADNTQQSDQQRQNEQDDISEQTERARDEANAQQHADPTAKEAIEEAREAQQRAEEAMERGDDEEARQAQREAADKLREAAEKLRQQADTSEGKPQPGDPEESNPQPQEGEAPEGEPEQSAEPQDELADRILEKEQRERERREDVRRALLGRPVPVERDW